MPSSANDRMYCYLDGTPRWCGNDGDDVDDDDVGDDDAADEHDVQADADGDYAGVNNYYASDNDFFKNEEGNSTGMSFTILFKSGPGRFSELPLIRRFRMPWSANKRILSFRWISKFWQLL